MYRYKTEEGELGLAPGIKSHNTVVSEFLLKTDHLTFNLSRKPTFFLLNFWSINNSFFTGKVSGQNAFFMLEISMFLFLTVRCVLNYFGEKRNCLNLLIYKGLTHKLLFKETCDP